MVETKLRRQGIGYGEEDVRVKDIMSTALVEN
jgi:hypothetical protein